MITTTYRIRQLTELIIDAVKLKFSKSLILKYKTELKALQKEVTNDKKKVKRLSKVIMTESKTQYTLTFKPTKPLTFPFIFADIGYKALREQGEKKEQKNLERIKKLNSFFRSVSRKESNFTIPTNEEILKVKA